MSSPTVLVANPSFDVYGADLQMLESVRALTDHGWRAKVVAPRPGPLQDRLEEIGAGTEVIEFPVLRRADATPRGVARLGARGLQRLAAMRREIRRLGTDLLYVNTLTIPWWLAASRMTGTPSLCHVHEAEPGVRRMVGRGLTAPLLLADCVVVNSRATLRSTSQAQPELSGRMKLVYNGVPGPPAPLDKRPPGGQPTRLVSVGRISARKATLDALEVASLLLAGGHDVVLELCGSPVPGQDAYFEEVRRRAHARDLAGRVRFSGYQHPVWPALERNDIFLATSTAEPLGNAVIESQLAGRPVVATAVEGHLETVIEGETGLLCPVGAPHAMASRVTELLADPQQARTLAEQAQRRAAALFAVPAYHLAVRALCEELASASRRRRVGPRSP